MSQYKGKEQHGYWWLHANNGLRFKKTCHNVTPERFFDSWTCIKWWEVTCELDWYRMMKEQKELAEGPPRPVVA